MKLFLCSAIAAIAVLFGFSANAQDALITVEIRVNGSVSVTEGAILEVQLLDVSKQDVAAEVISSRRFKSSVYPARVYLAYDPDVIDQRMSYTISSRVISDGNTILRTTTSYPVLTRGSSDSVVVTMDQTGSAGSSLDLSETNWEAFEIDGRAFIGETPPSLHFGDNGEFGIATGCNNFRGRAALSDGNISYADQIAGTRKACPPPLDKLEQDVLDAFNSATGYTHDGERLVLTNENGVSLIRFRKIN